MVQYFCHVCIQNVTMFAIIMCKITVQYYTNLTVIEIVYLKLFSNSITIKIMP